VPAPGCLEQLNKVVKKLQDMFEMLKMQIFVKSVDKLVLCTICTEAMMKGVGDVQMVEIHMNLQLCTQNNSFQRLLVELNTAQISTSILSWKVNEKHQRGTSSWEI